MSFFVSLFRIVKFALQNFWRNIWLSVITVTILVLTLFIVNILLILNVVGETAVRAVESKIDVSVAFVPDASEDIILSARGYLLSLPQVKDVEYRTAEEVLIEFRQANANRPDVLASLDEVGSNPFGGELVIKAHNPEDFAFILEALESPEYSPYIESKDFRDHEVIIARINQTIDRIRIGGIVLGSVFVFITVLIVFNTIRVAIYTHREEIGIMRLVGASSLFVRTPFLFEAILYTLLAVVISIAILYPLIGVLEPLLDQFFESTPTHLLAFFNENFLLIFGTQFVAFAILNMISTVFAMRKYLRV